MNFARIDQLSQTGSSMLNGKKVKKSCRGKVFFFYQISLILTSYEFIIYRARSIYERALDVDHRNITLWLKYTEMEMRNKQVNHARNLWDRAVTILPRANQFWYKYSYMEEMVGNIAGNKRCK
jgi:HAT (Half-A-TPR) repeat